MPRGVLALAPLPWRKPTRQLYATLAARAKLGKNIHCTTCHRDQPVDPVQALADGWPICCGQTMTIDPHETRCATQAFEPLGGMP